MSVSYTHLDTEIISNREYDQMYDELQALEKETGTVLANSPTVSVGYEAVDQLPKEEHESPMLSLDKTKAVSYTHLLLRGYNSRCGVLCRYSEYFCIHRYSWQI